MILSIYNNPSTPSFGNALRLLEYKCPAITLYNVWLINDDFPEPDTPVIDINLFNGIVKLMFLRLLPVAFFKTNFLPLPNLSFLLYVIILFLDKYCPVIEFL